MRASTYQHTREFLLSPDDPNRPASFEQPDRLFFQDLEAVGIRSENCSAPHENGTIAGVVSAWASGSEAANRACWGLRTPRKITHLVIWRAEST